jgi:cytochrome b561
MVRGAYHPVQVLLHWLVVALILEQYVTSGAIRRTHDALMMGQQPTSSDLLLHMIHNRGGILITGLVALRLALSCPNRWPRELLMPRTPRSIS